MFTRSLLLSLALAASATFAAPTRATMQARDIVDHDKILGFAEDFPATSVGGLMFKYRPLLKVFNGCVPFPAVDASGNIGGGLKSTGGTHSGCSSSAGQIYARAAAHKDLFAIMYSWYFPKDSPLSGLGHRHDWEECIVWLSDATAAATLVGFSVSAHGGIKTSRRPGLSGTNPLAEYVSYGPVNHQLVQTRTVGGAQPLIAWDNLTMEARNAINTADWGSARCPFKDSYGTFTANLERGYVAF